MRGQKHYRKELIMIYSNFPYLPIIVGKSDDFTDGYPLIILRLKCKFCRLLATQVGLRRLKQRKMMNCVFARRETFSTVDDQDPEAVSAAFCLRKNVI